MLFKVGVPFLMRFPGGSPLLAGTGDLLICQGEDTTQTRLIVRLLPFCAARQSHFTKEVVMVEPGISLLPRGKQRSILHDRHQIADMVEFGTDWHEREVIRKIEDTFRELLDLSRPSPRLAINSE